MFKRCGILSGECKKFFNLINFFDLRLICVYWNVLPKLVAILFDLFFGSVEGYLSNTFEQNVPIFNYNSIS